MKVIAHQWNITQVTTMHSTTKNQDVVTLWVKSGELIKSCQSNFNITEFQEYELVMARLVTLCMVNHNLSLEDTIKLYIHRGWIDTEEN